MGNADMQKNRLRRLVQAEDGAAVVEFALIAPVFSLLLIGALEIGHTLYMQGVLEGAVQKAARDGTLETAAGSSSTVRDAIDDAVESQVRHLYNNATVRFSRRFYRSFTEAAQAIPEETIDSNDNGTCDNGEWFGDVNNNDEWDSDGGDGIGRAGARDNVVYTVTVEYPRMFPLYKFIGGSNTTTLRATTVLSNQPFGEQQEYGEPTDGYCT